MAFHLKVFESPSLSIKPKQLLVNLLSVADQPISAQQLIGIAELFGITPNNARVTLARLTADAMVASPERGFYRLGPKASSLAEDISHWRELESRVVAWQGDWIGVYIGSLGRTDRTGLRRRMRILSLAGFEPLEQDLWLRPNNLRGGVQPIRQRLHQLGLEKGARVMRLDDFSDDEQQQSMQLWDVEKLTQCYRDETAEMTAWMEMASGLSLEEGTRESFLIGDRVLRHIVFDPLLPSQMIDVGLRSTYIDTMATFDEVGNRFFRQLYRRLSQNAD